MKAIIYKDEFREFWIHINEIQFMVQHDYAQYRRINIRTSYIKYITIFDNVHQYSISDIHDFINSEKQTQIIKVNDLDIMKNEATMYIKDWVAQAMG